MTGNFKAHIFVVDDDRDTLDVVSLILDRAKFECTCFTDADDCLRRLDRRSCDLLITDVKMQGKDGIELLTEAKRIVPWLPVLVMTAYGDIPLAVKAVKTGAMDFIEKPLDPQTLVTIIELELKRQSLTDLLRGKPLTKTEKIILRLILQDKSNKEIAHILHRSVRTVEVHRSHIMSKLNVNSVVELVKRAAAMGLIPTQ